MVPGSGCSVWPFRVLSLWPGIMPWLGNLWLRWRCHDSWGGIPKVLDDRQDDEAEIFCWTAQCTVL